MRRSPLLAWAAISAAAPGAFAGALSLISASEEITAVSSKVHNGYVREKLSNGSFKPETYALAVGGRMSFQSDDSVDHMSFDDISKIIVGPLAAQNYLPSHDLDKIQLLIVVYWGTTFGSGSTNGLPGGEKDLIDLADAKMLGFASDNVFGAGFGDPSNMLYNIIKETHGDVMSAIEANRYFIILLAVDFQSVWKHKKVKLLWGTRISLSERHHDFGQELPIMMQYASRYIGQDSHGLVMKPIPEGRVDIGPVKSLGEEPAKTNDNANGGAGQPPAKP